MTDSVKEIHQNPNAAQLANALDTLLERAAPDAKPSLNDGQKAFLSSWFLTLGNYASQATEEKRRLNSEIPMRRMPTASSLARTAVVEGNLYKSMLDGSVTPQQVASITQPDTVVFTAHPNFSEQPGMVNVGRKIVEALLKVDAKTLSNLAKGGDKAEAALTQLSANSALTAALKEALTFLQPRKPRSRADELKEATLPYIAPALASGAEEVSIMLKRERSLEGESAGKILSCDELDRFSAATSRYATWFTDGDGKRTSRAWDNEYAIIAMKHEYVKAIQGYVAKVMESLPEGEPLKAQAQKLIKQFQSYETTLVALEAAAEKRMAALTALQTEAEKDPTATREDAHLEEPRASALAASAVWRELLTDENKELLTTDLSALALDFSRQVKQKESAGELQTGAYETSYVKNALTKADALYLAAKKGEFPIQLERRENATQLKQTMRHLLKLNGLGDVLLKHKLNNDESLKREVFDNACGRNDAALMKVLEFAAKALSEEEKKPEKERAVTREFRRTIDVSYSRYASLIEPRNAAQENPPEEERPVATELETTAALFLDDLANLKISTIYPHAFNRSVIAEAATPPMPTLKRFDTPDGKEAIAEDMLLRGKSDMLTLNIFRRVLGSKVEETSLYEDPHAILHTPELLAQTLANPVYHSALGIDWAQAPERTLFGLDEDGKPKPMTAYEFMRQNGFDDVQLQAQGLNIEELRQALVYQGYPKMLANSDSAKRGTLATSTLNDVTIKESYLAGCQNLLKHDEKKYLFVNPAYLGQGGAIGRTTGVNLFASTYTEQGTHPHYKMGLLSPVEKVNRIMGRLASSHPDGFSLSEQGEKIVFEESLPLGNPHGLRDAATAEEHALSLKAVEARIRATRDDMRVDYVDAEDNKVQSTRYEFMLSRYGVSGITNYSARPASKGKLDDFVNTRAIGLNGKEFGLYTVTLGMAEMFEFDEKGKLSNLNKMAKYATKSQTGSHNISAAIFILNLFDQTVEAKWRQGGVQMKREADHSVSLTKGEVTVKLAELEKAYQGKELDYKGFDAADMAFAHFHNQALQLASGIDQVRRFVKEGRIPEPCSNVDPKTLVPEIAVEVVNAYRQQVDKIYKAYEAISKLHNEERTHDQRLSLKMALDSHHVLLETGPPAISTIALLKAKEPESALAA